MSLYDFLIEQDIIVINNNSKSNRLQDQVFWYKAEGHAEFKIGGPEFWRFSEENYTENNDNDALIVGNRKKESYVVNKTA
mgnify:CR=1 FL=1